MTFDPQISDYLSTIESAISDVGYWTWWTDESSESFQVEFSGTQFWSAPVETGQPPSSQIALRFRKPRLVYFLTFSDSVVNDWPDRLHRDELQPFHVDHEQFTLSSPALCGEFIARAKSVRALVGEPGTTPLPVAGEAFVGLLAGPVGLVIAAETFAVFNHAGQLDRAAVLESNRRWWDYWREYWRSKDTANPLPHDYACEVTIPSASIGDTDLAAVAQSNPTAAEEIDRLQTLMGRGEETEEEFLRLCRLLFNVGSIDAAEILLRRNNASTNGRSVYRELFGTVKEEEFDRAIDVFKAQFALSLALVEERSFLVREFCTTGGPARSDSFALLSKPCEIRFGYIQRSKIEADVTLLDPSRQVFESDEYLVLSFVNGTWQIDD